MSLKEAFMQLARERNIAPEVLKDVLENALASAYKRDPEAHQNVEVALDLDSGTWRVWAHKEIVEAIEDPKEQITLEEAQAHRADAQLFETIPFDVTPKDFGRLAAQVAKQVMNQGIRDFERKIVYDEYIKKLGTTLVGTVSRIEGRNMFVNLGKIESLLPGSEQIPGERFRIGERIKVYIAEVRDTPRGVQVISSRAHEGLVRELFELEVPEVMEGAVIIEGIAREAGHRTKIAVRSRDPHVDPIGACVGARGARIQAISSEIRNEKIEIIRYHAEIETYIANSLSPAKVSEVHVDPEERAALVIVPDNMLSLAIGREGQNVRLAAKLTGHRIDIKSETQLAELQELAEREATEAGLPGYPEGDPADEAVAVALDEAELEAAAVAAPEATLDDAAAAAVLGVEGNSEETV